MKTIAFALLFVAATAAAQTQPVIRCAEPEHSLTISGTGEAKVAPDRVTFTVGVATTARSVTEAFRTNNDKTRQVIAALKAAGVKDSEIVTTQFNVDQPYEGSRRSASFVVNNNVTVIREDPRSVSELLQAAIDAGANQAGAISFFVADPGPARDVALERAYADARSRAERLARAAGRTLGPVTLLTATPVPSYGYMRNSVSEAITVGSAAPPPIESGVTRVTESVTVTFELK